MAAGIINDRYYSADRRAIDTRMHAGGPSPPQKLSHLKFYPPSGGTSGEQLKRELMASERTWTIKGVSDRTRDTVLETAHEAGLTIGEWVNQALAKAVEEVRHPKPAAATREEVTEILDARLRPIEETLGRIAERLASLEEKAGQRAEAGAIHGRIQRRNPQRPRLGLPR